MNREVKDTQSHIYKIMDMLNDVEKDLRSAKGWGIYDIFKGGFFTSMIKHSKIGNAEKRLKSVSKELNKLQRELNHMHIDIDHNVTTSSFNTFLDIAFDNVFSDWFTQSNINDSLDQVYRIRNILNNLYYDLENYDK